MTPPFAEYVVGVVRIPIDNLTFLSPAPNLARLEKSKDVIKLVKVFQETGFQPSLPGHQIFGIVGPKTFKSILSSTNISRNDLLQTVLAEEFPVLSGNFEVLCVEGRRRVEAARLFLGREAWWTVKLHCIGSSRVRDAAIRHFNGVVSHEAPYSDGEIYTSIRYFQARKDDISLRAWKVMLTDCKARALSHLLSREEMCKALDSVMAFPGLRSGLQLGNVDKHLATHCDELIIHYLRWICNIWAKIVESEEVRQLVDEDTVRMLQFQVPYASKEDRSFVTSTMDSGILFRKLSRPAARERIKRRLLSVDVLIPSLETFHENMKYITIGAKILKTHLDMLPPRRNKAEKRTTTLPQRFSSIWDSNCQSLVEISEGRFSCAVAPPSFGLAFKQLFLSVLRQFSFLSTEAPLRDIRHEATEAHVHGHSLSRLFLRAHLLGFSNEKIRHGLQVAEEAPPPHKTDRFGPLASWRGGKPFDRTLMALQKSSFLPILDSSRRPMDIPTAEFVQNDLLTAFFGGHSYQIDHSKPTMSFNSDNNATTEAPEPTAGQAEDTVMEDLPGTSSKRTKGLRYNLKTARRKGRRASANSNAAKKLRQHASRSTPYPRRARKTAGTRSTITAMEDTAMEGTTVEDPTAEMTSLPYTDLVPYDNTLAAALVPAAPAHGSDQPSIISAVPATVPPRHYSENTPPRLPFTVPSRDGARFAPQPPQAQQTDFIADDNTRAIALIPEGSAHNGDQPGIISGLPTIVSPGDQNEEALPLSSLSVPSRDGARFAPQTPQTDLVLYRRPSGDSGRDMEHETDSQDSELSEVRHAYENADIGKAYPGKRISLKRTRTHYEDSPVFGILRPVSRALSPPRKKLRPLPPNMKRTRAHREESPTVEVRGNVSRTQSPPRKRQRSHSIPTDGALVEIPISSPEETDPGSFQLPQTPFDFQRPRSPLRLDGQEEGEEEEEEEEL